MPDCQADVSEPKEDEEVVEIAKQLTDSTLKRALAQLITEAIELDDEKEKETELENQARVLVSQVLRDSWEVFLNTCDLDQWLQEKDQMSHQMATSLIHKVQTEDDCSASEGNKKNNPGNENPSSSKQTRGQHESLRETGSPAEDTQGEEIRFHYDNNDCRIDLRVVRPYFRVVEHSNSVDKEGNEVSVLLFDASQLPARSVGDYDHLMQQILLYSIYLVEQKIHPNYSIVYLHGNATRDRWPRAKWLRQWCHALNSKTSKHLTQMLVLYPTLWIRTLRVISRPFVKFKPSVHFVSNLKSLYNHLPEAELVIPKAVKENIVSQKQKKGIVR